MMKFRKILSLVIVILIALSSFTSIISFADDNSDAQAISQIKETWGKMYQIKTQVAPKPYYNGWLSGVTSTNAGYGGATKDMLGNYYFTRKFVTDNSPTAGENIVYQDDTSIYDINNYDDFYFFYKVEKDEREDKSNAISINTRHNTSNGGGVNTSGCKNNSVNAESAEWVKITKADVFSSFPQSLYRLYQDVTNAKDVTITFGSLIYIDYAHLPESTDGWSLAEWITAAKKLLAEDTEYIGADKLQEIVFANDPEAQAIEDIKSAWKNIASEQVYVHWDGATNDKSKLSQNAADTYPDGLSEYFTYFTFTDTDAFENNNKYGVSCIKSNNDFTNLSSGYDGRIAFYIDADEYVEGLTICPFFRSGSGTGFGTGKAYVIKESDVGHWVTLTEKDFTATGSVTFANLGNRILLYAFGADENGVKITFTDFTFSKRISLPADSADWSLSQWLSAAKTLLKDHPEYKGTKELEEAIITYDPDARMIEEIKTAWKQMYTVEVQCAPKPYYGGGFKDADCVSTPSDGYAGATKDMLGNKYVTRKFADNENEIVIYEEGTKTGIVTCDDFYFYYKVEKDERAEKTATPSLDTTFSVTGENKTGCKNNSVNTESSEWVKLTKADVFSEVPASMWRLYQNVNNAKDVTLTFGSLIFIDYAPLPDDTAEWTPARWIRESAEIIESNAYLNTQPLKDIVEEYTFAVGDTNYDGSVDLNDLPKCRKALLGLFEPARADVYDVNEDAVFDIRDLVCLENKLNK